MNTRKKQKLLSLLRQYKRSNGRRLNPILIKQEIVVSYNNISKYAKIIAKSLGNKNYNIKKLDNENSVLIFDDIAFLIKGSGNIGYIVGVTDDLNNLKNFYIIPSNIKTIKDLNKLANSNLRGNKINYLKFDGVKSKGDNKIVAKDKYHLKQLIQEQISKNGNNCDLNHIDVSNVRSMNDMFRLSKFNGDISKWDVSKVESMVDMFNNSKFNGDISKWDVSNVRSMYDMFRSSKFNGDISKWDVSNVDDMFSMFLGSNFNGDISKWDVSNVKYMYSMFCFSKFNGDISKWNVSNVKNMKDMFYFSKFNGDISKWNVSNVKNMKDMFRGSPLQNNPPDWYRD